MDESDERAPDPIDVHVGDRIRRRRRALGMTQQGLAAHLGIAFQQVQKYERGANRVSASKLYGVARALQAPIPYFFEGLPVAVPAGAGPGVGEAAEPFRHEVALTPEERELASWLSRIDNRRVRRRILELVRVLAETELGEASASEAD